MTSLDQISQLADLIHATRPTWDKIATQNQLLPYKHLPYEQLAHAAIRCAQDPTNRTPASLKWADLAQPEQAERKDDFPWREPTCYICGRKRGECWRIRDWELSNDIADPHEFESADVADRFASQRQIDERERAKVTAAEVARTQARAALDEARPETNQPEQDTLDA